MKKNWKRIDGPVWVQDFHRSFYNGNDKLLWYYRRVKYDSLEIALKHFYYKSYKFEKNVLPNLVIFDECGLEIPQSILKLEFEKIEKFKEKKKRKYKFRDGPVPGISGKWSWNYYRNPKTLNEIKGNAENIAYEVKKEYGISLKGRKRNLPSSWDDIYRNDLRSWKKTRKTQYKVKE